MSSARNEWSGCVRAGIAVLATVIAAALRAAPPLPDEVSDFGPPSTRASVAPATMPTPQVGTFQATFIIRSELSGLPVVSRRLGWSIDAMQKTKRPLEYDLSTQTFQLYVPADYDGTTPYGLIVWVGPGGGGNVPIEGWHNVLDRHKLIWIGPNGAGNDQYWPIRVGLALDAVANAKSRYRIDDARVWAAGLSGGGRTASMLGVGFPDVYTGGYYMVGCDFYRDVPLGPPGKFWARNFFPPPAPLFRLARTHSRQVLLTGDGDTNQNQTECNYHAFVQDGFEHVTLIEIPGLGHRAPDAGWFEKGIEALEGKLPARQLAPATAPANVSDGQRAAQRELQAARLYIEGGLYEQARQRLDAIIRNHAGTEAAAEAQKMMREIAGK